MVEQLGGRQTCFYLCTCTRTALRGQLHVLQLHSGSQLAKRHVGGRLTNECSIGGVRGALELGPFVFMLPADARLYVVDQQAKRICHSAS